MSSRKKNRYSGFHSLPWYEDILFVERAERLINYAIAGRGGSYELAEVFLRGYPIDNLKYVLDNHNISAQLLAIEVCYEIGKLAKPYVNKVSEMMNTNEQLKTDYGIAWLADYADEYDELANWMILSSLENKNQGTVVTAMRILAMLNFGQIRGAEKYLLKHIPKSIHLLGIDLCLNHYDEKQSIMNMLKNKNILIQKYVVVLASRFFVNDAIIRKKCLFFSDEAIRIFIQEQLI